MKLKHQRLAVKITVSLFLVGMLLFSTTKSGFTIKLPEFPIKAGNTEETASAGSSSGGIAVEPAAPVVVEPPKSASTLAMEIPVEDELLQLIDSFFTAEIAGDELALKSIVMDSEEIDMTRVAEMMQDVEYYENLSVMVMPGEDDDSRIVFCEYDMKVIGIDTPATGLSIYYAERQPNGAFKLYFSMDDRQKAIANTAISTDDVQSLIDDVNKKFEEETNTDLKLKAYFDDKNSES